MVTTLSVEDCLKTCNKFCKVIEKSFGPRGQLSFIITCTGQGQFSTSGMTIMEKIHPLHPIARIILRTLQKYYESVGDGSKAFILLLNEIFIQISECQTDSSPTDCLRMRLIHGFTFLLRMLPDCFEELRIKNANEQTIEKKDEIHFTLHLLKTYFRGKFGVLVSDYLSDFVHCLLVKHHETFKSTYLGIKYTLYYFGVLCSPAGTLSLGESQLIPGVVLSEEFAVCSNSKITKPSEKFMIILMENLPNEAIDASLIIKNEREIFSSFEKQFHRLRMSTKQKVQEGISLIICTGNVSEHIKGLCREYGIRLITLILPEEVNYLLELSQIQPVGSFTERISEENSGILDFVKTVRIGNKDCVHLGLKYKETDYFPYHLILNGPSNTICKQYLKEMHNSLTLLYLWKKDSDNSSKKSNEDNEKYIPSTCSSIVQSLQNGSQQMSPSNKLKYPHSVECTYFSLKNSYSFKERLHYMLFPAGGCWELCLNNILTNKKLDNSDLLLVCRIVSKSLVIIPRTLYTNNCNNQCRFPLAWELMMKNVQSNKLCYLDEWGEVQTGVANRLEPVIAKEMLITEVIQLVIQLLRLHSIVNIEI